jgi:hypothetical protein
MTLPGGVAYYTLNNQPYMGFAMHGYQGFDNWLYSGYIQDDWRISDSLVIIRASATTSPGARSRTSTKTVWKPHMGVERSPRLGHHREPEDRPRAQWQYYRRTRSYNFWSLTPQGDTIYYLTPEFALN